MTNKKSPAHLSVVDEAWRELTMQRYKEFIIQTNFFDEKVNSGALSAFLDQKRQQGKVKWITSFLLKTYGSEYVLV